MPANLASIPETQKSKDSFYPTPRSVAMKMARLVKWDYVSCVLEPSAGKGDLAREAAYELYKGKHHYYPDHDKVSEYVREADIDCVEIDPNRAYLDEKGFRIVHDDFLTYHTNKRYDLIFMNPPFSDGAKHLWKALDMIKDGGQVVCLLNAQTIKNPFSYDRRLLVQKLDELGAAIEYMPGAFVEAERGTDTEIAMIYVSVEYAKTEDSWIMEHLRPAHKYVDGASDPEYEALAKGNFIDAIIDRYNYEVECGLRLIREWRAICPLIQDRIHDDKYASPILELKINHGNGYGPSENEYVRSTRKKYWVALFESPQFMQQLTSNLQNDLYSRVNELADYEFSAYNIYQLMEDMNKRVIGGIEQTIMNLFDDWTRKYHWDENAQNRHYFDGWCTNDAFAVNKKVIIPLCAYTRWTCCPDEFHAYNVASRLADIEKVFNFLDGGIAPDVDLNSVLSMVERTGQTRKVPTKHFFITFYKKGTCHIEFRNPDLLAKFNIFAARHKKWLPPSFGKKRYKEMNSMEKKVVDSFMGGEAAYDKVLARADYFLADTSEMLALPGA